MMLEIDNLSKTYRGRNEPVRALDGVTLTVDVGEFVAVQGPSGCGKTTLLLAAGALLAPGGGSIRLAGVNPYRLTGEQRARFRAEQVGFVFQQFHLVPYLTVLDNVLAASLAKPNGDARGRALGLLHRFGMADRIEHVPAELSTGERQRTALARALLNEPKLLLADEPTGNLDADNALLVQRHLGEFAAAGGAVLWVTHDAGMAQRAQRIIHMRQGRIVPAAPE